LPEKDRVTLFVDTKTSALRRYERRGTVTPTDPPPLPPEVLDRFTPDQRERLAKRSLEPFDVESTIEIAPSFDVAIENGELEGNLTLR
jgi:hypothetical protein